MMEYMCSVSSSYKAVTEQYIIFIIMENDLLLPIVDVTYTLLVTIGGSYG